MTVIEMALPPRGGLLSVAVRAVAAGLVDAVVVSGPASANDPLGLHPTTLGSSPAFELAPVEDGAPRLTDADLQGEVSLLDVRASRCLSCRDGHRVLMSSAVRDLVPLHGLDQEDAAPGAARWLRGDVNPHARAGFDADGRVATELGPFGVPQTFVRLSDRNDAVAPTAGRRAHAPSPRSSEP